ncbi:unnamed protein product [Amoebophrya sp. A120]|nr:unnamed protein product [Amoebophrya sp. A120]|eukprot:GSA120T00014887001.1
MTKSAALNKAAKAGPVAKPAADTKKPAEPKKKPADEHSREGKTNAPAGPHRAKGKGEGKKGTKKSTTVAAVSAVSKTTPATVATTSANTIRPASAGTSCRGGVTRLSHETEILVPQSFSSRKTTSETPGRTTGVWVSTNRQAKDLIFSATALRSKNAEEMMNEDFYFCLVKAPTSVLKGVNRLTALPKRRLRTIQDALLDVINSHANYNPSGSAAGGGGGSLKNKTRRFISPWRTDTNQKKLADAIKAESKHSIAQFIGSVVNEFDAISVSTALSRVIHLDLQSTEAGIPHCLLQRILQDGFREYTPQAVANICNSLVRVLPKVLARAKVLQMKEQRNNSCSTSSTTTSTTASSEHNKANKSTSKPVSPQKADEQLPMIRKIFENAVCFLAEKLLESYENCDNFSTDSEHEEEQVDRNNEQQEVLTGAAGDVEINDCSSKNSTASSKTSSNSFDKQLSAFQAMIENGERELTLETANTALRLYSTAWFKNDDLQLSLYDLLKMHSFAYCFNGFKPQELVNLVSAFAKVAGTLDLFFPTTIYSGSLATNSEVENGTGKKRPQNKHQQHRVLFHRLFRLVLLEIVERAAAIKFTGVVQRELSNFCWALQKLNVLPSQVLTPLLKRVNKDHSTGEKSLTDSFKPQEIVTLLHCATKLWQSCSSSTSGAGSFSCEDEEIIGAGSGGKVTQAATGDEEKGTTSAKSKRQKRPYDLSPSEEDLGKTDEKSQLRVEICKLLQKLIVHQHQGTTTGTTPQMKAGAAPSSAVTDIKASSKEGEQPAGRVGKQDIMINGNNNKASGMNNVLVKDNATPFAQYNLQDLSNLLYCVAQVVPQSELHNLNGDIHKFIKRTALECRKKAGEVATSTAASSTSTGGQVTSRQNSSMITSTSHKQDNASTTSEISSVLFSLQRLNFCDPGLLLSSADLIIYQAKRAEVKLQLQPGGGDHRKGNQELEMHLRAEEEDHGKIKSFEMLKTPGTTGSTTKAAAAAKDFKPCLRPTVGRPDLLDRSSDALARLVSTVGSWAKCGAFQAEFFDNFLPLSAALWPEFSIAQKADVLWAVGAVKGIYFYGSGSSKKATVAGKRVLLLNGGMDVLCASSSSRKTNDTPVAVETTYQADEGTLRAMDAFFREKIRLLPGEDTGKLLHNSFRGEALTRVAFAIYSEEINMNTAAQKQQDHALLHSASSSSSSGRSLAPALFDVPAGWRVGGLAGVKPAQVENKENEHDSTCSANNDQSRAKQGALEHLVSKEIFESVKSLGGLRIFTEHDILANGWGDKNLGNLKGTTGSRTVDSKNDEKVDHQIYARATTSVQQLQNLFKVDFCLRLDKEQKTNEKTAFIVEVDGDLHTMRVLDTTTVLEEPSSAPSARGRVDQHAVSTTAGKTNIKVDRVSTGSTLLRNQVFRNLRYSFYVISWASWSNAPKDNKTEWVRKILEKKRDTLVKRTNKAAGSTSRPDGGSSVPGVVGKKKPCAGRATPGAPGLPPAGAEKKTGSRGGAGSDSTTRGPVLTAGDEVGEADDVDTAAVAADLVQEVEEATAANASLVGNADCKAKVERDEEDVEKPLKRQKQAE